MKSITNLILALFLMLGVFTGCGNRKSIDFSVTSIAVLPQIRTIIFMFGAPTDYEALVVKEVQEDVVHDLSSYLSLHGRSITKATSYAEVWDVKYLRSPEHTGKTYHVFIRFERPLAPGEIGRGFSLDGRYDSISFVGKKEAEEILLQDTAVRIDSVPHELHYMSKKTRWPGRRTGP